MATDTLPYVRGLPLAERFWRRVRPMPSGCWEFQSTKTKFGYGLFKLKQRMQPAHRVAWELENGPIPEGLWVLHHCDNPPCVRVDHLYLGTGKDNAQDREERNPGTQPRGSKVNTARLSEQDVRTIRRRAQKETLSSLGREYGVQVAAIWKIVHRHTWRHV
jgi:hypothetical protein